MLPLWVAVLDVKATELRPLVRAFEPSDYGGPTHVLSATHVPSLGGSFISTVDGVYAFNGGSWNQVDSPGLTRVRGLRWDGSQLWVGGYRKYGVINASPEGLTFEPRGQDIESEFYRVWSIERLQEATYIIGSQRIFEEETGRIEVHEFPTDRRLIAHRIHDQLYVHQRGVGLFAKREPGFELITADDTVPSSGLINLMDVEGSLVAASVSEGLFSVDANWNFTPMATEIDDTLKRRVVTSALYLPEVDSIAVGTLGAGVFFLSPEGRLRFQLDLEQLSFENVVGLTKDVLGRLWILSPQGFALLDLNCEVVVLDLQDKLSGKTPLSDLCSLSDGGLIGSTVNGAFVYPVTSRSGRGKQIADGLFWDLQDANGTVIASARDGLYRLEENSFVRFLASESDVMRTTYFPENGKIGVVAYNGIAVYNGADADSKFLEVEIDDAIPTGLIPLEGDTYLLGTASPKLFELGPSGRSAIVFSGVEGDWSWPIRAGDHYYLLTDQGIWTLNLQNRSGHLQQRLNLSGDPFEQKFWIDSQNGHGVLAVRLETGQYRLYRLGREGKFVEWPLPQRFTEVNAITVEARDDRGQMLWLASNGKLYRISLKRDYNYSPERPRFSRAQWTGTDDETFELQNLNALETPLELPAGTAAFKISFGSDTSLLYPVEYDVRLQRADRVWTQSGFATSTTYSGLAPGKYQLSVTARRGAFQSETIELPIVIHQPWYTTSWAIGLFVLGAFGSLASAAKFRNYQLRQQNAKLEAAISARTQELEHANLELARANNARAEFIASVSHEIRNPMNGILGLAEMLLKHPQQTQNPRTLQSLVNTVRLLTDIIDGILDLSSIDARRISLKRETVHPAEVLDDLVEIYQPLAVARQLNLVSENLLERDFTILSDASRIRQILGNLLSNAIKYSEAGTIRISAEALQADVGMANLEFAVADEGPGIPEAMRESIFARFNRGPQSASEHAEGVGLGLALARELAQALGGELTLDSSYKTGARFSFRLPAEAGPGFECVEALTGALVIEAQHALIVEDHAINREVLETALKDCGLRVTCCVTAAEVFDIDYFDFDIAFVDLNLPDAEGTELVPFLRDRTDNGRLRIIASTAHVYHRPLDYFRANGFDGVLAKPYLQQDLLAILQQNDTRALPSQLAPIVSGELLNQFQKEMMALKAEVSQHASAGDVDRLREASHRMLGVAKIAASASVFEALRELHAYAQSGEREATLMRAQRLLRAIELAPIDQKPVDRHQRSDEVDL
ncbi:MAG: ATP-binding protein [Opitutales bacterium]